MSHSCAAPKRIFGLLAIFLLAACQDGATISDRAELDNLWNFNALPKSSPTQLVAMFDRSCVAGPTDRDDLEAFLRDLGYVPTSARSPERPQTFLSDDQRPAIAVTDDICAVRSLSRTGQTERVRDYVAARFPDASPVGAPSLEAQNIEQAWRVDTPQPGIVATQRNRNINNTTVYTVIYFRSRLAPET